MIDERQGVARHEATDNGNRAADDRRPIDITYAGITVDGNWGVARAIIKAVAACIDGWCDGDRQDQRGTVVQAVATRIQVGKLGDSACPNIVAL